MSRKILCTLVLCSTLSAPVLCRAQSAQPASDGDAPTLLAYGLKGLWTGAFVGLAAGYVTTGPSWQSHEWRKLVVGAGVGALVGVGGGVALAVVDNGKPTPGIGWLALRDTGYGSLLGVLTGTAVGALFWAGGGRPRDVLMGGAIGTVAGAGVGALFGVVEGINAQSRREREAQPQPLPPSLPSPASAPRPAGSGAPRSQAAPRVLLSLAVLPSASGVALGPALMGRF